MSNQAIWLIVLLGMSTMFGFYRKRTDGRIKLSRAIESERHNQMPSNISGANPEGQQEWPLVADTSETETAGDATPQLLHEIVAPGEPSKVMPASETEAPDRTTPEPPNSTPEFKFGQPLGTDVTLVQFSSAFCQPCRATRLLLDDVAASTPGVVHIEIDAEAHLDLVREMGVTRTPTTFILNGRGDVVGKSVGLPKRLEVMNVVQAVTATT